MTERDQIYLEHILDCIEVIREAVSGGEQEFRTNRVIRDAVLRNLQLIGESTKRLSDDLRATRQEIPWSSIIGLRNVLVHDYLGVDPDMIWRLITSDLPDLEDVIRSMLSQHPDA